MKRVYQIKTCQKCGEEYQPMSPTQKYCIKCRPIMDALQSLKHNQKQRDQHPDKIKEYQRAYYGENKEHLNAYSRTWRREHPERCRTYNSKERGPRYYLTHSEKINEESAKWKRAHPDVVRAIARKHKAKRRNLAFISLNEWFEGCEGHHINKSDVIHIPKTMHDSVKHNIWTGKNMKTINTLALKWLIESS